ncbi:MAG: hypothetical protein FWF92_05010 [Oscillospiraceae bacterium]|nr:hypothetical protein [Oscillospiraceae bacterium]
MDEETREQEEQKEVGDYLFDWKRKFDNFWYHYKIAFIIGVIILIFVIFCIAQCASRVKGDANIAYIGAQEIDSEMYDELQYALNQILDEDLNGDGKIHVDFTQFLYMTGVQAENMRAIGKAVDYQSLMTTQTQINLELTTGNIIIYFINPEVYKELAVPGRFMPLEDALGYVPEYANDVYSIKLGSLQCWDYYEGIYNFPSGTLVVLRDMQVSEEDNKTMQDRYERNLTMFRRLVEFKFKDDEVNTNE